MIFPSISRITIIAPRTTVAEAPDINVKRITPRTEMIADLLEPKKPKSKKRNSAIMAML